MKISSSLPVLQPLAQPAQTQQGGTASDKIQKNAAAEREQSAEIAKLRARDREVRAHEQAHASAAGGVATGGPNFTYKQGPDGKQYAVGGEVNIDTSPVAGDPEATIRRARQIRAAALAPADPSAQDQAVAASAGAMETKARAEIQQNRREEPFQGTKSPASSANPAIDIFV